jgi:hypothetical protein
MRSNRFPTGKCREAGIFTGLKLVATHSADPNFENDLTATTALI